MIDVSPSLALLVLVGVMVGCGTVLVLERSLSRIVIGASLITYGVNVMVLMAGGRAGGPPIIGQTEVADMADPEANIIFGAVIDEKMTDEIRVTIIATGFEPKRAKPGSPGSPGSRVPSPSQPEIAPIPKFQGATLAIPDWMKRK